MKKKRVKAQAKPRKSNPAAADVSTTDRRGALRLMRNLAIGVPVFGAAGYLTIGYVEASICEFDLTKIGDGLPSVVQVHDPQCDLCLTLQRQTRRALRSYDDESFHFLVANVATLEGRLFAQNQGVANVTLVLLDGGGQQVGVVRGPLSDAELRNALAAHLDAYT